MFFSTKQSMESNSEPMLELNGLVKPNAKVLLSISMGQENQTGKGFSDMANAIIRNCNITAVTLLITNTLQRHNIKVVEGVPEEKALILSKERGELWKTKNEYSMKLLREKFGDKFEIKDWDDWRLKFNDEYVNLYQKI